MPRFTCEECGAAFSLPPTVLDRYPGWTPRRCRACRDGATGGGSPASRASPAPAATSVTTGDVLARYHEGPETGVFTDGGSVPNPGPGGWGAVYVVAGEIVAEAHGHDPDTTNNRMELTALGAGIDLVPEGTPATIYSDSRLVVQTMNEWASGWERRGWRRRSGPVENLDLVRPIYLELRSRPGLTLRWIPAHSGLRWNEYADALATAWRRDEV
jgi:ribonuclease HI